MAQKSMRKSLLPLKLKLPKTIRTSIFVVTLLLASSAKAAVTATQTFDGISDYTVAVTITNETVDANLWAVDIASTGMVPGTPPENWYTAQFDQDAYAWVSGIAGAPPAGSDVPPGGTIKITFHRPDAPVTSFDYTLQFMNSAGSSEQSGTIFIPEPLTLAVLGIGLTGMLFRRKRP